jgi:5-methylcytosine-specific restriction endonuclease McrA
MSMIEDFLSRHSISEDDALTALLSAFGPPQPGVIRQNWCRSSYFGNCAPSTGEIWSLFERSSFRCIKCGSGKSLTLDHIDGDSTNHNLLNLRVLCSACNRGASGKPTIDAGQTDETWTPII